MPIALFLRHTFSPAQPRSFPLLARLLTASLRPPPPTTMLPSTSLPTRHHSPLHTPLLPRTSHLHHLPTTSPLTPPTLLRPHIPAHPTPAPRPSVRCFIAAPNRPPTDSLSNPQPPSPPAPHPHPLPHPSIPTPTPSRNTITSNTAHITNTVPMPSAAPTTSTAPSSWTTPAPGSYHEAAPPLPAGASSDAMRLEKLWLERAVVSQASGRIDLIVGPTAAGKTAELLKWARAAVEEGQQVAYVRSTQDKRHPLTEATERGREREACFSLDHLMELPAAAGADAFAAFDVIAIDEAHLFPDLVEFCRQAADVHRKTVIVVGQDGDHQRRPFPQVLDLVPMADAVHKVLAACSECGHPAPFTAPPTTPDAARAPDATSDTLRPLCRSHYPLPLPAQTATAPWSALLTHLTAPFRTLASAWLHTDASAAAGRPLRSHAGPLGHLRPASAAPTQGRMELVVGPMFAGKSTELLKRARAAAKAGHRVAYVNARRDKRYSKGEVVTHDGEREACFSLDLLMELPAAAGADAFAAFDVIAIDEAQFFPDLPDFCDYAADIRGKTVIVAGLDGDYKRQRFGAILDLVPRADVVVKLVSCCSECGQPAPFTSRTVADEAQELVGGSEMYRPMCRLHHVPINVHQQQAVQ